MIVGVEDQGLYRSICKGFIVEILNFLTDNFAVKKRGMIKNKRVCSLVIEWDDKLIEFVLPVDSPWSYWFDDATKRIAVGELGCVIMSEDYEVLSYKTFDMRDPGILELSALWVISHTQTSK